MDRKLLIFFLTVVAIISLLSFFKGPLDWDALVYIMNAKKIISDFVYYENFRPPLLPFLYAILFKVFSENEIIPRILSALFSIGTVFSLFFLIKKLYGNKIACYGTLFFIFSSAFLIWSISAYTEIPSLFLIILSVLAYFKGRKNFAWFFISGLLAGMAFLFKYTSAYIIFSLLLIELIKRKKDRDFKGYLIFLVVFFVVISPLSYYSWAEYGNPFYTIYENFRLSSNNLEQSISQDLGILIGLNPIVIIASMLFLIKFKKVENDKTIVLLFLPILIFFIFFAHRELRYFLLSYPLLTTFAAIYLTKTFGKLVVIFLVFSAAFMTYTSLVSIRDANQYNTIIKEASLSVGNLSGTFYSNFWPYLAYYSEKDVATFPWPPEKLIQNVGDGKVQYFIIYYPFLEPCYLDANTLGKLPFLKNITERGDLAMYEIDLSKFSNSERENYLSILKC